MLLQQSSERKEPRVFNLRWIVYAVACACLLLIGSAWINLKLGGLFPSIGISSGPKSAFAQASPVMRLRFVDTETNARVVPPVLWMDDQDWSGYVDEGGQIEIPADEGYHEIFVSTDGYEDVDVFLFATASDTTYTEFRLLPWGWYNEGADSDNLFLDDRHGRLVGYARDKNTGATISGATVRLLAQDLETEDRKSVV